MSTIDRVPELGRVRCYLDLYDQGQYLILFEDEPKAFGMSFGLEANSTQVLAGGYYHPDEEDYAPLAWSAVPEQVRHQVLLEHQRNPQG